MSSCSITCGNTTRLQTRKMFRFVPTFFLPMAQSSDNHAVYVRKHTCVRVLPLPWFVFKRSGVHISVWGIAIPAEVSRLCHSIQENAGTVYGIRPRPLPAHPLTFIIPSSLDTTYSELLKASLKYHKQINETIYTAMTERSSEIKPAYCDIRGSHSSAAEDKRILKFDDESLGEQFSTFRNIVVE
jgi:hypothetical protein